MGRDLPLIHELGSKALAYGYGEPRITVGRDAQVSDYAIFVVKDDEPISIGERTIIRAGCTVYYGTVLEEDVRLGHDVFIRERCRVGAGTTIGTKSLLEWSTRVGKNCLVEGNVFLSEGTVVGDDTFIGPMVRTTSDNYMERGSPAYMVEHGKRVALTPVRIGNRVKIGAGVTILPDIKVGDHSVIGAGCVVTEDVSPYSMILAKGVKGEYLRNILD